MAKRLPPDHIFQEGARWRRKIILPKYTAKELAEIVKREGTSSDWDKAARMTKAEIEARVASDPHEADMVMD